MTQTENEILLLAALRSGENDAFSTIYNLYSRQLLFLAGRITGNVQAAEDIVADSFIKVLKKRETFESLQKLKSFLVTITQNASRDWLRAEKRHTRSHEEIARLSGFDDQTIDREIIRSEVLQVLYQEIEKLPGQYAEIIRRSFIKGESLTEIAEKMGLAYKTIQNLKARAVQQLRLQIFERELSITVLFALLSMLKN